MSSRRGIWFAIAWTALGDRWFGFEINFDWGAFPLQWLLGDREKIHHGYFLGYWWLTNDEGRWDHFGEEGKGFYLTRPEIKRLPALDTLLAERSLRNRIMP